MKFLYIVRNLRSIADCLEDDKNLESGDLQGAVEQLTEIIKVLKDTGCYFDGVRGMDEREGTLGGPHGAPGAVGNHTPTPWKIEMFEDNVNANELRKADVELIVRAVNNYQRLVDSHDELIKALRHVIGHNEALKEMYRLPQSLILELNKAIAKASASNAETSEGK